MDWSVIEWSVVFHLQISLIVPSIEHECSDYSTLSSRDRSFSYKLNASSPLCGDETLPHGWYRFIKPAGTGLVASCPTTEGCGTNVPGWLNGSLPLVLDGISNVTACFSWKKECCQSSENIKVRNCGRFDVYKLHPTIGCPLRYCASD